MRGGLGTAHGSIPRALFIVPRFGSNGPAYGFNLEVWVCSTQMRENEDENDQRARDQQVAFNCRGKGQKHL